MTERFAEALRSGEWWDHKMVPILCAFYASALVLGVPLLSLWREGLLLLAALVPGAIYVSVVNDLTDIDADAAARKANRMAGRGLAFRTVMLLLPVAAGGAFAYSWRGSPLLLALYGAAWLAFTLYSVPPARLKTRGFSGVLADAAGAHLFPTLLAAACAFRAGGAAADPVWFAGVGLWAFAYGVRGNLWHQLLDRERDRAAGLATFAARNSPQAAIRIATRFAFPLEVAALSLLLWKVGALLPPLLLAGYALLVWRRVRLWRMAAVVVRPSGSYLIVLHEYYDVFLPLALLGTAALANPADGLVLLLHLLLFHRRPLATWSDGWGLILRPLLQRLHLVGPPPRRD